MLACVPTAEARTEDQRLGPALAPLAATALYRIDATQVETRLVSPERYFDAAFSRKATPSYFWGVRLRKLHSSGTDKTARAEAEYAYKILDKFVLGTSLGYHSYHPGLLMKTEWYEVGASVDYLVRDAVLTHASVVHGSYFLNAAASVSIVSRYDDKPSVTVAAQNAGEQMLVTASVTHATAAWRGEATGYALLKDGWRPGLGLTFAKRLGIIVALNRTFRP